MSQKAIPDTAASWLSELFKEFLASSISEYEKQRVFSLVKYKYLNHLLLTINSDFSDNLVQKTLAFDLLTLEWTLQELEGAIYDAPTTKLFTNPYVDLGYERIHTLFKDHIKAISSFITSDNFRAKLLASSKKLTVSKSPSLSSTGVLLLSCEVQSEHLSSFNSKLDLLSLVNSLAMSYRVCHNQEWVLASVPLSFLKFLSFLTKAHPEACKGALEFQFVPDSAFVSKEAFLEMISSLWSSNILAESIFSSLEAVTQTALRVL